MRRGLALALIGFWSLALAQLVSERPLASDAEMLSQVRGTMALYTVIAPRLSPSVAGLIRLRSILVPATIITDRAGLSAAQGACGGIIRRRTLRVYMVERIADTGMLIAVIGKTTRIVQGGLVIGSSAPTRLLEGEPMASNLATQILAPLLKNGVLQNVC